MPCSASSRYVVATETNQKSHRRLNLLPFREPERQAVSEGVFFNLSLPKRHSRPFAVRPFGWETCRRRSFRMMAQSNSCNHSSVYRSAPQPVRFIHVRASL